MSRSLGKMSVYKLFNWRDSAADTIQLTVQAFLELGEAVATRWIQTRKGVMLLQMVPATTHPAQSMSSIACATIGIYCPSKAARIGSPPICSTGLLRVQAVQLRRTARPVALPDAAGNRLTLPYTTHRTKSHSQPGGIPCAYPLAAFARSRLVTPWPRPPPFPASAPNPTASPPTANPRLTSSTAGCASPPVLKHPNLVAALTARCTLRAVIVCAPSMGALLRVQVPPQAGHSK